MNENEKILSELRQNNRLLKLLILISISGNEYKVSDKSILHGLECLNRSHSASAMFEKKISHIQLNDSDLQKKLADYFKDQNKSEMDYLFKSFPSKP